MKSVGEKLRRARIERGIDLAKLASQTKIQQRYLEAIETGNTDALPSGFFYRSFVRQYATALGMNAAEIEAELDRLREAEAPTLNAALQEAEFPIKAPDPIVTASNKRYLRTGRWGVYMTSLVVVLAGCSAFYAWWHRLETAAASKHDEPSSEVSTPSAQPEAPRPATPPAVAQRTTPKSTTPPPQRVEAPPAETAIQQPVSADDRVVVRLAATEQTWVAIVADGRSIFQGILQPNQSMTLGGKVNARIRTGNAGGIEISWNGKALGALGPKGQVRTVVMTPENYRIIAPVGSL